MGQIAVGNPDAIAALIKLLRDPNGEGGTRHCAAEALSSILSKTIMPSAIWQLKNDLADEVYRTRFKGYSFSYFVLFQCAKTLSYSEFHTAWHPSLPIIPFDPTSLHHQLNRPHTAILDLSNFHSSHPIDIAQELADLIFLELNPTNIPEVQTIPQFKRHLLQHSQPPHLVIIIHHPHPTTELITAITSLHSLKQIQIIWLTNTPIENAIPPNQPNLAGVIQEAIDRFTES